MAKFCPEVYQTVCGIQWSQQSPSLHQRFCWGLSFERAGNGIGWLELPIIPDAFCSCCSPFFICWQHLHVGSSSTFGGFREDLCLGQHNWRPQALGWTECEGSGRLWWTWRCTLFHCSASSAYLCKAGWNTARAMATIETLKGATVAKIEGSPNRFLGKGNAWHSELSVLG